MSFCTLATIYQPKLIIDDNNNNNYNNNNNKRKQHLMEDPIGANNMQSQHSGLASLPTELLNKIAGPLSTNDFNALRSTCKPVEDKLFPYWANCFFKKKQFMIDEFSLQALVDISQHQALSKVMTHIIIGLEEFQYDSERVEDHHQWAWRAASTSQKNLLQTGIAIDRLSTAFANLPNLKAICIRDFNSPTRYRDAVGPQASEWRSYGSSFHRQWNHKHFTNSSRSKEFNGLVFKAILTAIDRCSPELNSLEVSLRNRELSLIDDSFAFSPALGAGLTKTLYGLTKLHLELGCNKQDQHFGSPPLSSDTASDFFDPLTAYTRNFLAHTKNVEWLRLNFSHNHGTSTRFFNWLSLEPGCDPYPKQLRWDEMNPAPIALPLRQLDLGRITVQPDVLHKVLAKFPDLMSLCLKDATLHVEDGMFSHRLLDDCGAYEDGDCVWARFIRGLSICTPSLRRLLLSNVRQDFKNQFNGVKQIIFSSGHPDICWPSQLVTDIDKDKAKLEQLADKTWTGAQYGMLIKAKNVHNNDDDHDDDDEDEDEDEIGRAHV